MFFDIETSYCQGWFWQPSFNTQITYDQIIKDSAIICICWKWEGSKKVHHLEWNKGDDKRMINKFVKELAEADEVIGHNGDRFDLKWVRTRLLFHGHKSIPEIRSIDTLKISRNKFKFPSNRLDAIGKYLGLGGKMDTGGIQLWHDIIQKNSKAAMAKMVKYCKRDVVLLEEVYKKLEGFTKHKTHIGIQEGNSPCSCPSCANEKTHMKRRFVSPTGTIKVQLRCSNPECKRFFLVSLKHYNDRMSRKKNKYAKIK